MPSLRLTAPGHPPTVYHLHKKITSLGSGPDNDIVLPDPLVPDGYAHPLRRPDLHGVRAEEDASSSSTARSAASTSCTHDDRIVIGSCRAAVRDGRRARADRGRGRRARSPSSTRTRKLFEFSERLMPATICRAARRADGRGHRDHERRQGLPGPDGGRRAARQGRAQPARARTSPTRVSQLSDSIIAKVVRDAEAADRLRRAAATTSSRTRQSVVNLKLSSVMCVPLLERGNLLGVIYVGNDSVARAVRASRTCEC